MLTDDKMTPERQRAYYKFKEAQQHLAKGHLDSAIDSARDALEFDATFIEVRHWIAEQYDKAGETRKAIIEYQDIVHNNHDDDQAWDRLRALDPAAAQRLERLQHIAPDPFVSSRPHENLNDEFDDLGSFAEADEEAEDGVIPGMGTGVVSEETISLEEMAEEEIMDEPEIEDEVAGPPEWLHEQDMPFRDKLMQHPLFERLLPQIVEFWEDDEEWDKAMHGSVHLDVKRHPEVAEVFQQAADYLGISKWNLYFCPDRHMICTITRGMPPTVSITSGVMNTLPPEELLFVAGRLSALVAAGHIAYQQLAFMLLQRSPRTITDVEVDLLDLLVDHHKAWDVGLKREERQKLGALSHAWQQRAELSADRGGLLVCGDVEKSLNAIARTVAPDAVAAERTSWRALLEKYRAQDVAKLAAIPPKEDPLRNEGYGVYRIRMLKWWATTDEARRLMAGD